MTGSTLFEPVDPRFKLLGSYWYLRTINIAEIVAAVAGPPPLVFADSGAHSARTQGVHLGVEQYAGWCEKWLPCLDIIANLDVIGGPAATWRNQKILEAHGLTVLPVFHTGEDWSWLERYLDEGYTYIALGKLLGNPWKVVAPWIAKAFRVANGRCVFHGFGMTTWEGLRDFPFYSVDSSTWTSAFKFGRVGLFDRGRWVQVTVGDRATVLRHRELIRSYGWEPDIFLDRTRYRRVDALKISAIAWKRAEWWVRARHGPITIPPGDKICGPTDDPGLHLYLADMAQRTYTAASLAVEKSLKGAP